MAHGKRMSKGRSKNRLEYSPRDIPRKTQSMAMILGTKEKVEKYPPSMVVTTVIIIAVVYFSGHIIWSLF